jgi:energy-coupling factor transporter transmembrane protein EcfT
VAYPLAAIFIAQFLYQLIEEKRYPRALIILTGFHAVIIAIVLLVTAGLMVYVFPAHPAVLAAWAAGFFLWLYLAFRKSFSGKLFWLPAIGMVIANIFLTNHVYTTLLQYQCGSQTGRYMHDHNIPASAVAPFKLDDPINCLHFYAGGVVTGIDTLTNIGDKKYLLTMEKGIAAMQQKGIGYDVVKEGSLFKVSELTPGFLNPATRKFNVRTYFLVKLR